MGPLSATIEVTSRSVDDTLALGQTIGQTTTPNTIIALNGPLGAGKTHFVKGLANGLGVIDTRLVNSPTFVLINEYDGRLHIYHVDVYRLGGEEELDALGFEEMCTAGGVVVIEWADKVRAVWPVDVIRVDIQPTGDTLRQFTICPTGKQSEQIIEQSGIRHV